MLSAATVDCPYCWESFETSVDCSAGDQSYVEDCTVCCHPILFHIQITADGELGEFRWEREND